MAENQTPEGELPEINPSDIEALEEIEPALLGEIEPEPEQDEPISLVDEDDETVHGQKIQAFGKVDIGPERTEYKRPLNVTGIGATRCKIFHSKIGVGPMEFMENTINEWLDDNHIEVKSVTQVVGVLEGKRAEPNLIVMVWY